MSLKFNIAWLLWAAMIYGFCTMPMSGISHFPWLNRLPVDKLAHTVLFGILVWLMWQGFSRQLISCELRRNALFFAWTLAAAYGGTIEIAQQLGTSGRTAELWDFIADWAGIVAGLWLAERYPFSGLRR